ncbi:MAG: hypothetical protein WCA49_12930 [Candidatus Sulfotelmatobacter sp.]
MREPRSAVMIRVQASWLDQDGTWQVMPARMEDKSVSGACIRFKKPIAVGSKLKIQSPFEQFFGITKYCRSDGWDFLVGIQREKSSAANEPPRTDTPLQAGVKGLNPLVSTAQIQSLPQPQESRPSEIPPAPPQNEVQSEVQSGPIAPTASRATATLPPAVGLETGNRDRPLISRPQKFDVVRRTEVRTNRPPNRKETGKENKPMRSKWLERAPWRHKQDVLSVSGGAGPELNGGANREGRVAQDSLPPRVSRSTDADRPSLHPAEADAPSFYADLLPMEDVYSAVGIPNPPKGYSINKVIEMLRSEHIHGLSKDLKRAAVLMALEVAGVSLDHIQQDSKARQDALDSYEAAQQEQVEAEWARKAEENAQIQAELERIQAHYMARISRNLDGVAREKARFNSWQTMKKEVIQSMSEAVDLCVKATATEPASPALANAGAIDHASAAAAGAKPS